VRRTAWFNSSSRRLTSVLHSSLRLACCLLRENQNFPPFRGRHLLLPLPDAMMEDEEVCIVLIPVFPLRRLQLIYAHSPPPGPIVLGLPSSESHIFYLDRPFRPAPLRPDLATDLLLPFASSDPPLSERSFSAGLCSGVDPCLRGNCDVAGIFFWRFPCLPRAVEAFLLKIS